MPVLDDVLHADFSGGLGNQLFALLSLVASGQSYCCCRCQTPSANPHSTVDYTTTVFQSFPQTCATPRRGSPGPPRHAYAPQIADLASQLSLPKVSPLEGAFLHIRGGDYLGHPFHFLDLTEYYQTAVRHFPPDTHFYVFTNDRAYVERQGWLASIPHTIMDEEDELTGLASMAACTLGGICSNSTYAWWGAALNPSRTIVLPSRWMNTLEQPDYRIPGCIVEEVGVSAYCIHLPHRVDRLATVARLQMAAPWLQVHLVDAVETPGAGWKGCLQSHQAVVRFAKEQRLPYVLVLEDDCEALVSGDDFKAGLLAAIDVLTTTQVQIVSGCGNLVEKSAAVAHTRAGIRFLTAPDVRTTHCILYGASSYDAVLSFDPEVPIDVQMNRCSLVFTYPYLATQQPGYSDIEGKDTAYTNIDASRVFVKNLLETPRLNQEVHQPVNLRPVFRIPIRTKRV